MAPKLPALGMHSLIVSLPDFDLPDLVPACEVLWQEGIRVWTASVDRIDNLPELLRLFGRRAKLGVHGVMEPEQVRSAATAGALFAACDFLRPQLVDATPELPVILGGMTPTELLAGLDAGAAAVQLVPSDAFGSSLARSLPRLLPPDCLIANGRMEPYQGDLWKEHGALGVWPQDLVTTDLVLAESLDGLRVKLQKWRLGE